jgi:phospholipid/cholesterol/gamma-HCH transport system substrate-binding protein
MRRQPARWAIVAMVALTTAGCGLSAQTVPLPGTSVSGDTYPISADFGDALNLTDGAPVKLNGATVGQVQSVSVHDYTAKVDMVVQTSVRLHAGASARLRGTTPLGELYVELEDTSSSALLPEGATLAEGTVAPTIEDAMATTSVFLNGGGITEIGTILRESNKALGGREGRARDLLERLNSTTAELRKSTDDLDQALASLADLSTSLKERRSVIRAALRDVAPTARAMRAQIDDLSRLLRHIEKFGVTTSGVIDEVNDDLVSSLTQMGPIFDQMNALDKDLTPAIERLVVFSKRLDRAVPTQYLNTDLHIHLDELPTLPTSAAAKKSAAKAGKPTATSSVAPSTGTRPLVPQVNELLDPKGLVGSLLGLLGKKGQP